MSNEGPKPYPVVYDAPSGSLQYVFQSGQVTIPEASVNAITTLTGQVTATGPGSAVATVANSAVIAKVLTGYTSGAGTVSATDSILTAFQKLNGNQALNLPLTGGTLSGPLITGSGVQPTHAADIVVSDSTLSALAITGKAVDGSTSTDGVLLYLMHNGSNNRQLGFVDSGAASGVQPAIRFVLNSGSPAIDVYDYNLGAVGSVPLTLGNATNGIVSPGRINTTAFKLSTSPTSGYVLTSDSAGVGTWQAAGGGSRILAQVALTGQVADISATTIYTPSATGLFLVSVYFTETATANADTPPNINVLWTDDGGSTNSDNAGVGSPSVSSAQKPESIALTFPVECVAGQPIQYSITGGTYTTQVYSVYITVSQL